MSVALRRSADAPLELLAIGFAGIAGLSIALLPRELMFAASLFVTLAILSAWRPAVGVGALVLTIPIQASVTLGIGDHQLTLTKIALIALLMGWVVDLIRHGEIPRFDALGMAFVAYACALIASIWNAQSVGAWSGETHRWVTAALVYLIASHALKNRFDLLAVLISTSAAVVICTLVAGVQVLNHSGPPSFTSAGVTRAFGAFGEPNPFAAYFEIAFLPLAGIAMALWLSRARHRSIAVLLPVSIASCAGLAGVYLTHSRGGAIGTAFGILTIAVLVDRRSRRALAVMVGIAAMLVVLTGSTARIVDRASSLTSGLNNSVQVTTANFSESERIAHWRAALKMWEAHPVVGVGAGNFNENFRVFTPEWRFRIPRGHAHNNYLQAAAQAGTLGLICYLSIFVVALSRAQRLLARSIEPLERGIAAGAIAATIAVMTHSLFDYLHVLNLGLQLSAVWALVEYGNRRSVAAMTRSSGA